MSRDGEKLFGIKLKKSKRHTFDFSGTKLDIQASPFSMKQGIFNEMPYSYNIYDHHQLGLDKNKNGLRGGFTCYVSGWSAYVRKFLLPFRVADLDYSVSIEYVDTDSSLFVSNMFEEEINHAIEEYYGQNQISICVLIVD